MKFSSGLIRKGVLFFIVFTGVLALLKYLVGFGITGGIFSVLLTGALATCLWVLILGWAKGRGATEDGGPAEPEGV